MNRISPDKLFHLRMIVSIALLILVESIFPAIAAAQVTENYASALSRGAVNPLFRQHFKFVGASTQPPTDSQCRAKIGSPCYSPQEIRTAYDVAPLLNAGYTGKGQSIVIVDSFGSPTLQNDLHVFDQGYGLPDPPSLKVLAPLGTIQFDPKNSDMVGWAVETALDVEWAHALAPGANIVLMTSPVSETEGVQGIPEFLYLEKYAVDHHLGKIVSQSWAATENTLFTPGGRQILNQFNAFYRQATTKKDVTFFASSGDSGASNVDINGNTYPFPTVGFPASSPYVTAVGGTSLYASTSGEYQSEAVWDEVARKGGASGGGVSQYFKEPAYQKSRLPSTDQKLLNGYRGIPDIAYNADRFTSILVYISFIPGRVGYHAIGGTSEGSPQWAGIAADINQLAGHPLGFLNPTLYRIGNSKDYSESFHDITVGNNTYSGVQGYDATPGWDASTGWGSPKVAVLADELVQRI